MPCRCVLSIIVCLVVGRDPGAADEALSYRTPQGVTFGVTADGLSSIRIADSYAVDDSAGVGVSPWRTGLKRTLILWDYGSWAADKRESFPERKLLYFVVDRVPARGGNTFDMKLRVSPNRDWKHLLAPCREHFTRTFGPVQYKADYRWIATDYMNHSQQAVSETNPYGFHGGFRRIDTPEGVEQFCDAVIPVLREQGGQGRWKISEEVK